MFPVLLLFGLGGLIAWAAKPKPTGVVGGSIAPKQLTAYSDAKIPPGFMGPPLLPEEERLLALLVLWQKDKKFPPGSKRFMTRALAEELVKLALRLNLHLTAQAVLRDRQLPETEMLGRRGITVRQAVASYATRT